MECRAVCRVPSSAPTRRTREKSIRIDELTTELLTRRGVRVGNCVRVCPRPLPQCIACLHPDPQLMAAPHG
ncbi:hypothetical protein CesoFtcFv8_010644 [Champsocephalus esox]|uniref:Uncharacterized protein n=1 Tax=Champsocephalus esox TaxID=159716 RepID=A0AAN8C5L8_9TELE|nr:hypothetical protein CesoFtcFv8_010644 [Champsocephalus esox]